MGRTSDARQRLIDAALELMHERSYAGVGVQALCAKAGVYKGSFYHFFPSKLDLSLAAIDEQWRQTRETIFEPAFAEDLTPLERLERFFTSMADCHRQRSVDRGCMAGCLFGNLALELGTQEEPVRERIEAIFDEWTAFFVRALAEAVDAGQLPPLDVDHTAQALLAYQEGMLTVAKTRNDPDLLVRLAPMAMQLVRNAAVERESVH